MKIELKIEDSKLSYDITVNNSHMHTEQPLCVQNVSLFHDVKRMCESLCTTKHEEEQ